MGGEMGHVEDEERLEVYPGGDTTEVGKKLSRAVDNAIDNGAPSIVTRGGKVAAIILPISMEELAARGIANDPELAARLAHASAHPEDAIPASDLFKD